MGRAKQSSFGKAEVAGVFKLPEGKKIYPNMKFEKTNMAKGEHMALEDPDWANRTNPNDISFRVTRSLSLAASIEKNPLTYKSTFDSTTKRGDMKIPMNPGFLEYGITPRASPSIERSIRTPANRPLGADNEISYKSTFKTKYKWPIGDVKQAQGGSLLKKLDSKQGSDALGTFPITEHSIAQEVEKSPLKYSSSFKSTAPLGVPLPVPQNPPIPWREHDEMDHPLYVKHSVAISPHKYSAMTNERGSHRVPPRPAETADIKDFYDIQSYGPKADLANTIERSPIRYSNFNMSKSHIGEVFRRQAVDSVSFQPSWEDEPSRAEREYRRSERDARRRPKTSMDGASDTLGGSQPRFLPDGHPMSMFKARMCNNEFYNAYEMGTIKTAIQGSPMQYSAMWSSTSRSGDKIFDDADKANGPPVSTAHSAGKAWTVKGHERPKSVISMATTPFAPMGTNGSFGPDTGGATPVDSMPGRKGRGGKSSLDATCSMLSTVPRFQETFMLDTSETDEHKNRRQHLLESRIQSLRENRAVEMSKKLKKILNM